MRRSERALVPAKYLTETEEADLLGLMEKYRAKELRNTTLMLFMLKTGARPSEALNLLWHDINFADRSVFIRTLKGGPDRVIPLTENMLVRFQQMGPGLEEDSVFKISYSMLLKIWLYHRPTKKRLHCLRHTFAVNFYKKSKDLWLTQLALGHACLQTTAVYLQIHSSIDDLRSVIGD